MFSTKAEYGVRVMVALAQRAQASPDGGPEAGRATRGDRRARRAAAGVPGAPRGAAAQGGADRQPQRGSRGGYMLARAPPEITMAEVVEALEGSIAPIECISQSADGSIVCSRESDPDHVCPTKLLWTRVRFSIVSTLDGDDARRPAAGARSRAPGGCRSFPGRVHATPAHRRNRLTRRRTWPTWRYVTCTCASRSARSSKAST